MPQQQEVGSTLRWRSNFLVLADLANRVTPLLLLHWLSRDGYSDVLTYKIISGGHDAWLHGVFLSALLVVALTATILRPLALLGFNLFSIMIIYSNLPRLEESRQKLAEVVGAFGEDSRHPPSEYDPTIKASYRIFLQVFVGLAVMRFPAFSSLFSTAFSPTRLLALSPVISAILLAFSPKYYVLLVSYPLLPLALAGFIAIAFIFTAQQDLGFYEDFEIHYAHLRRVCERLERLRLSRFFSLVFVLHMVEVVGRTLAGAYFDSAPTTWFTFGEELLRRSCDTTISLIGFACVSMKATKYAMRGVRYVLGLQCPGEDLKDEIFLLSFSLALFARVPLTNHSAGLDCLVRFLHFYVMSWMMCLRYTIGRRIRSYCEDIQNFPLGRKLSILSVICFEAYSRQILQRLTSEVFGDSFVPLFLSGAFLINTLCGAAVTVILSILIILSKGVNQISVLNFYDRVEDYLSVNDNIEFVMRHLLSTRLLEPEIFSMLDMRIYTYGHLMSQMEMYEMLKIQRREAAALKIEFREATFEELAREDHTCSICYDEMDSAAATACSHIFHLECLREWMKRKFNCPKCRRTIISERS